MADKCIKKIREEILQSSSFLFHMAAYESLADYVLHLRESLRDVASFLQECSINPTQPTFPSQQKLIAAIAAFGLFTATFSNKFKDELNISNVSGFEMVSSSTPKFYEDLKEQSFNVLEQLLKILSSPSSTDSISFISHMAEANKKHTTSE